MFARLAATLMMLLPSWSVPVAPMTWFAVADHLSRLFCTYTRRVCAASGDGLQRVCSLEFNRKDHVDEVGNFQSRMSNYTTLGNNPSIQLSCTV